MRRSDLPLMCGCVLTAASLDGDLSIPVHLQAQREQNNVSDPDAPDTDRRRRCCALTVMRTRTFFHSVRSLVSECCESPCPFHST